ncbi:Biotin carboxylase domain-containing protein [Rozella allomycis CSF55]|uniref:Biotin carboxylase domain-containing protein n=1 Tax=Rozella allomycis (strain CSF55) TaxID=988480 RepID=A0A075AX94_ROZAC|nr:Biotin carboxylase domain-containing protein [Rozella allomycis CSF55]|eukprot:EPZ34764.1 Biotin carboxylase domain-containing protein [Rozella allomycis CSF55]
MIANSMRCFELVNFRRSFSSLNKKHFDKVLIANRGEIAVRVIKTAKKLGIKTVSIYSEPDRDSMHVGMADNAYYVGKAPSKESYLNMDKIIEIAKLSGSQAIHPGYGFLSENAKFADALEKNNLTFIGPPSSAIRSMGSKSESKRIMMEAKVPVVPGYHGENQDPQFLKEQADLIGYPVLIKAVSGGGGKGMRIVESSEEFFDQLESSKRESLKSFNDDKVLVEKYLMQPRHVEVQIFGDKFGNVVHLFERDCSVQRRHQKIIEEAPAPNLSPEIRKKLGEQAVNAAKAVNYVGAGTVEFIMDSKTNEFYFMEMNTRLQVEHPISEMITGLDFVEWQFLIASGNPLPLKQEQIKLNGHAFEARIYAENPSNNFLPDTGILKYLQTPKPDKDIRIETGVRQGDTVSVHYDPMIAKLAVHSSSRDSALSMLLKCLNEYRIVGMNTNIDFLKVIANHPEFRNGNVETGFIQAPMDCHNFALATMSILLNESNDSTKNVKVINDPYSPYSSLKGCRFTTPYSRIFEYVDVDGIVTAYVTYDEGSINLKIVSPSKIESVYHNVHASFNENNEILIFLDGVKHQVKVVPDKNKLHLYENNEHSIIEMAKKVQLHDNETNHTYNNSLDSPMPCKISYINVKKGQKVKKGQTLLVLEAMKMEHNIKSPFDGTVDEIFYNVGDMVEEKKRLIHILPANEAKQ